MRLPVPVTPALTLLVLLSTAAEPCLAQRPARPFPADSLERANQLYNEKRYRAAGAIYERLLTAAEAERYRAFPAEADAGSLLGALHFNRANAHLRMGELGRAILHYEKAGRHLDAHPGLRNNLEIARSRIEDPVPELPRPFWERWALGAADSLGARGLFYLGLLGYLTFLTCAVFWAARTRRTRLVRALGGASLLIALIGVGGALAYSYQQAHLERAVVLEEDSPLYRSPEDASEPARRISEGVRVRVRTETPRKETNWVPVHLSDGQTGWMRAESLGRI